MKTNDILKELDILIPNPVCSLNYSKDYELLIAVMLSAQSTDERVNSVTKELFKYDLKALSTMNIDKIQEIIRPVGTQIRKSQYIISIAQKLLFDYDGVVPCDRSYIESLPGVGHKTCNVILSELFNEPAIAVDTHVSRVSKRLGFSKANANPNEVEKDLMRIFPKEKWGKLHLQLLLFGRYICKSQKPLCKNCPFKKTLCIEKNLK